MKTYLETIKQKTEESKGKNELKDKLITLKYGTDKNIKELSFNTRNCIILAANGMGKSSLTKSVKINNEDEKHIELILANKILTLTPNKQRRVVEQDTKDNNSIYAEENESYFGWHAISNKELTQIILSQKDSRENNIIQNDFDFIIGKLVQQHKNKHARASINYKETNIYQEFDTKAEKVCEIWNNIFNSHELFIQQEDWSLRVKTLDEDPNESYSIRNISDGERSALYLITKVLLAPNKSLIIVDETETHLNSSLLQKLWDSIEEARPDCNFMYVSHDIEFALSRKDCTKFWIKDFSYKAKTWDIQEIKENDLPEELILQIIGSKNEKILFVESTEEHDKQLYEILYDDFKVVPVGSCQEVINYTKILNSSRAENYKKSYYGLIDRDFRKQKEIEKLEKKNIYTLKVAELENLFFEEKIVFEFLSTIYGEKNPKQTIEKMKKEVFKLKKQKAFKTDFYKNRIQADFNQNLQKQKKFDKFSFEPHYKSINQEWEDIISEDNYSTFLTKLKCKEIKSITKVFNAEWKAYYKMIIAMFNSEHKKKMKELFFEYMPKITTTNKK